jgi:transposase
MLALALILQVYTGVSDDEVIEATLMDRRWQLALDCLDAEESTFSKGTFVASQARLIERRMDRRLLERTVEIAAASKAFSARNLRAALDSSPLWGTGRLEDTYNLFGHALRKALCMIAREQGWALAAIAQEADVGLVAGSSLKATLDLDWDDPEAREQALGKALQTLERVEQWLATNPELITEESVVPACLEAARRVRTQDVMADEAGKPVLVKGVAKDRRISIEDTEMRHERKSRSVRVDCYKRHVMRDLDSELMVAVGVTPANAPEASVAEGIKSDLKRRQITVKELHIDRAYLSSTLVSERSSKLEIFCKAWPVRVGAFFPKTAFIVDWEREVLRRRKESR